MITSQKPVYIMMHGHFIFYQNVHLTGTGASGNRLDGYPDDSLPIAPGLWPKPHFIR